MLERSNMVLNNEQLREIIGGGNKFAIGVVVSSIITLLAGFLDGYFRPLKCNK